jgi:hypothetical protein
MTFKLRQKTLDMMVLYCRSSDMSSELNEEFINYLKDIEASYYYRSNSYEEYKEKITKHMIDINKDHWENASSYAINSRIIIRKKNRKISSLIKELKETKQSLYKTQKALIQSNIELLIIKTK